MRRATLSKNSRKIFCIGCNKTGTVSLKAAVSDLGFRFGDFAKAARMAPKIWPKREFGPLIDYCHSADAFQGAPFGFPYTYQAMDAAFPRSRFILTVRDSAEVWYDDLVLYHGKLYADGRVPPTKEDLQRARRVLYKGRPWQMNRLLFDTPEDDPYERSVLIQYYERHVSSVIEYFRHRPEALLVLNVAEPSAHARLCRFLDSPVVDKPFPHLHRT